jgi:hypothetical protein
VCVGKERAAKVQCKGAMPVASGSDARQFMAWPFESISSRIKEKIRMVCAGLDLVGRRKFISSIAATQLQKADPQISQLGTPLIYFC